MDNSSQLANEENTGLISFYVESSYYNQHAIVTDIQNSELSCCAKKPHFDILDTNSSKICSFNISITLATYQEYPRTLSALT